MFYPVLPTFCIKHEGYRKVSLSNNESKTPMQHLDFALIDSHIHQWDPYNTPHAAALAVKLFGNHPQLLDRMVRLVKSRALIESMGLTPHLTRPYLPQDYRRDTGSYAVEQVVHVEANWHHHIGKGVVEETRFIESLAFGAETVKLGGIVATADLRDRHFKNILKLHSEVSPRFRGIRKMASFHKDQGIYAWENEAHLYRNKKFLRGFEALSRYNLSFDAWVYSTQLNDVINLAKQFPDTPIVLDHLGTPAGLFGPVGRNTGMTQAAREDIFLHWKDNLAELACCTNVYTKMSGLFMPVLGHRFHKQARLASKQELFDLAYPMIHHALTCFGINRVMFASNFPMDSVSTSLVNLIDVFSDIVFAYDSKALKPVFHHNAKQFYRLE